MAKRPNEHLIGERAVFAVQKVIADAEQTVEEIKKDYGEDLMVQTNHAGRMDASRLWFQVKGTDDSRRHRLKRSKGELSYSVSFEHAVKWIRSVDLVIVVLWDVKREEGWYAIPRRQINEWPGTISGASSTTLRFGEHDQTAETEENPASMGRFTVETMKRLVWESRFEHFRLLLLSAFDTARERGELSTAEGVTMPRLLLLLAELLELLSMLDRDAGGPEEVEVTSETRQRTVAAMKALFEDPDEVREDESKVERVERLGVQAAEIATLERLAEIDPDLVMPGFLLERTAEALAGGSGLGVVIDQAVAKGILAS